MYIRRLNDNGLAEFERYVERLREEGDVPIPDWLLIDDRTSEALDVSVDLGQNDFESRYELGAYLCSCLGEIDMYSFIGDRGFWSWIALFWFDLLCPEKNGKRRPLKYYNYVLSADYRHRPRHAIYMTWQLVDRYGEHARFLLSKSVPTRGELIEQLMARQDLLSSEGVMVLASELYSDLNTGGFKRGAASRKSGGCVSRYVAWLQQLDNTYDLFLATADDLKEMLPSEFKRFLGV